jgi:mRNA interferase MazF
MMTYKCGDVVLLPFPFTDQTSSKQRFAIVLSSNWFNENRKDIIVMAVTSQVPPQLKEDELLLSLEQQKQAGLPKKSIVKVTKIVTIDQVLVKKRLGMVTRKIIKKLNKLLKKFIG